MIVGRLGRDPEMRYTPGGKAVANFSVAVSGFKKDDPAEWFACVAWDRSAEFVNQYLKKGGLVLVEGRMQTRSWDKDGSKQYKTELIASTVQSLESKARDAAEENTEVEQEEDLF